MAAQSCKTVCVKQTPAPRLNRNAALETTWESACTNTLSTIRPSPANALRNTATGFAAANGALSDPAELVHKV